MHLARVPAHFHWEGSFPHRKEVPTEILYGVTITFQHRMGADAQAALRQAIDPIAGTPKQKKRFFGAPSMEWASKGWPVRATLAPEHVTVSLGRRVKGAGLTRFIEALAALPGAQDLRIEGQRVAFKDEFDDIRACTPCMAGALQK